MTTACFIGHPAYTPRCTTQYVDVDNDGDDDDVDVGDEDDEDGGDFEDDGDDADVDVDDDNDNDDGDEDEEEEEEAGQTGSSGSYTAHHRVEPAAAKKGERKTIKDGLDRRKVSHPCLLLNLSC